MSLQNPSFSQPLSAADWQAIRQAYQTGDQAILVQALSFLNEPSIHRQVQLLLYPHQGDLGSVFSPAFARVIHRARTYQQSGHGHIPKPLKIDSYDEDFIAQLSGLPDWHAEQYLARLALEATPIRHKAAVVGTMRDDGIYILEWVAHYRILGFEHLFVYTNDNADGSDALLARLAEAGLLTVIENEVTRAVPPEAKAFGHAMNLLPALWEFEWALFVDSDEYLMPAEAFDFSILRWLDHLKQHDSEQQTGAVLFDWLWMVSNMVFKRHPGLLCERFQHAREHWLGKCLVRLRDVSSMRQQHCPDMMPGKRLLDSALSPIDVASIWDRRLPEYAGGQINHYWPRSFEEFAIKKARGAALGGDANPYDRPYKQFFEWNGFSSADNLFPTHRTYLARVHTEMVRLKSLPGVMDALMDIEHGFQTRLSQICSPEELQRLYVQNQTPPGDL